MPHRHRWTTEEIIAVFEICRDNPEKHTALQLLRTRFPDAAEYSDGALAVQRNVYEKHNDGRAFVPWVKGVSTASALASGRRLAREIWNADPPRWLRT